MADEKITDPRAAFVAGYMQARDDHGTAAADGKAPHGVECDNARNDCNRCTCDAVAQGANAIAHAAQQASPDPRLVELEQRAVQAELAAANERADAKATCSALAKLRNVQQKANRRRFQDGLALEGDVEKLANAARAVAEAYGKVERFEQVAYDEHDEDDPGPLLLSARAMIPALAGLLSELAVTDHPSIAYPTPGQRTVRIAEAAARGVLGDPAGTITQAVYATLEAAVELRRVRELRGGGEPEPTSSYEISTGDEVWVRSPLRSDRWVPAIVIEVEPDGGPVTLMSDGADTSDRFSRMTIPQPVTFDQVRPRGSEFDHAVITPPVEERAGAASPA